DGAEAFARAQGLECVDPSYFSTTARREQLEQAQRGGAETIVLDHDGATAKDVTADAPLDEGTKLGTVGAVALDRHGNLAAATSTGGMTNKKFGRIGDSPVIGAGTYANDATCAVSCTGHGELFLRAVVAYDVSSLMAYKNLSLEEATHEVVMKKLVKIGGEGGLVAIDKAGNIALPFNSEGMYRA